MPRPNAREAAKPFSIRLTESERAHLSARAGTKPVGLFVRELVLGDDTAKRASRRSPLQDAEPLARALAILGQSEIAGSLGDLARQANDGTLFVDEDVTDRLVQAYDILLEMRFLLLQALGKSVTEEVRRPAPGTVSRLFQAAVLADRS